VGKPWIKICWTKGHCLYTVSRYSGLGERKGEKEEAEKQSQEEGEEIV